MSIIFCLGLIFMMNWQATSDAGVKVEIIKNPAKLDEETDQNLRSTIEAIFPEFGDTNLEIELIAWACKLQNTKEIPNIVDDVILLATPKNGSNKKRLFSLRRIRGSDNLKKWVGNMEWVANDCGGAVEWNGLVSDVLDTETLAQFIQKSNFGNNELFRDTKTVTVYHYGEADSRVISVIETRIDANEKNRRLDLFMRLRASPADH